MIIQTHSFKTAPWCEQCEQRMKMRGGYFMGGSHDWASYRCEGCGDEKMLHEIHDPKTCPICGPYTEGSPLYHNWDKAR